VGRVMHGSLLLQLLILLVVANGAAVAAKKLLGAVFTRPLDGGALFVDGQPVFGPSKTIRGIVLSVLVTSICAATIGLGGGRNSDRDLRHGRRSLLQLRETQTAPSLKQHGHRSRSHPGVSLPPPRQPAAAAVEHSRHCDRGDDFRCGRIDLVAPPFQVESSRRAPLTGESSARRVEVVQGDLWRAVEAHRDDG
jgi:hypothetical protein